MNTIRVSTAGEIYDLTFDGQPVGPDYVAFTSLYIAGDTLSDGTMDTTRILARDRARTEGKIITFPEGRFTSRDFQSVSGVSYLSCHGIPKWLRGIFGLGAGALGSDAGTIFSMKPMSSTKASLVPVQGSSSPNQLAIFKQIDGLYPGVWEGFHVEGTDQGHNFAGCQFHNVQPKTRATKLLSTGWQGDAGSPPGETAGLIMNGSGENLVEDCEVDGRRTVGGPTYGAMGMTLQNTVKSKLLRARSTHCRAANFVFFQALRCEAVDGYYDAVTDVASPLGNGGFNMERGSGHKLTRQFFKARTGKLHVTCSSDTWTQNYGGTLYTSAEAGPMFEVVDPTFNDIAGNGRFYSQSWNPYEMADQSNGNVFTQPNDPVSPGPSRAPWIHKSDGTTIPQLWILGSSRYPL